MRLTSPTLLFLALASTAAVEVRSPAKQPAHPRAHFAGRWIGQDGHDYVGPTLERKPSGVQDIHIELIGIDPRHQIVFVEVTGEGADRWCFGAQTPDWKAELRREQGAPTADLFFEPNRIEVGRRFHVLVRYDDGSTARADLRGGKADPRLRSREATLAAQWVGQDGQDWTGTGAAVGPDGLQDVHIHLSGLAAGVAVKAIRIEGPAGARWEQGTNPKLLSNAELVRDPKDPSQGELYLQPSHDLSSQRLKVRVAYDNDKFDAAILIAGRCDPAERMRASPMPVLSESAIDAAWLGQDGGSPGSPGDVHVRLTNLPASVSIVGAVLTDSLRGTWIHKANERVSIPADPSAHPLLLKPAVDGKSVEVFFHPYRDESNSTLALRLITADGRGRLVRFAGASCDLGRRARRPDPSRIDARPGDDLQALVERYGTVVLRRGTYPLSRPLVLNKPVTLTSDGGATLLFVQGPTEPGWTTAIKLHAGNTTLNGFAIRFRGPVRWNSEVAWGPAVLGMTDSLDAPHDEAKVNVAFTRLDLEFPPVEDEKGWVDAPRLMRLVGAKNGLIAGNVLRGGTVEFFGGPWRIVDNDYRGTPPGTVCHGVFAGHETHDLVLRGNRARAIPPAGKTWRFLVLSTTGCNDVVERNTIEGIGALASDTIPWSNEPEIILTEAYHLKYEGKLMNLSADRRILQIGRPQTGPVQTGDVVSLLRGPAAGQWRRIVQAIDTSAYLVDSPIPVGTEAVSISSGFVNEVFEANRIDVRGGLRSTGLVFVGNHFGTRVVNNQLLGGDGAFKLTACPSETPVLWGWSHAPYLEGVVEGNIIEDSRQGGVFGVEHDPRSVKSNEGRVYMTVRVNNNVVRWSEPFLRHIETLDPKVPCSGLTVGFPPSNDPHELVVRAKGNRLEAPVGGQLVASLNIEAAEYNAQRIVGRRFQLPSVQSPPPVERRAASKRPATNAR
jgi:hypothetical protein